MLNLLDAVRAQIRARTPPCAWSSDPRPRAWTATRFVNTLLAQTGMEYARPVNLVCIGTDGRPRQKGLREILVEWLAFRTNTVVRRTRFRLDKVIDRIHVLEGRMVVYLNVDEVIQTIRESDEPRAALMGASACPSGRPRTSSKCGCAGWPAWKDSRSSRSWPTAQGNSSACGTAGQPVRAPVC